MLRKFLKWTASAIGLAAAAVLMVCLVPVAPTVAPIKPRPGTHYWQMSNGYRIAYTRVPKRGSAAGAPILFLHGGPGGYVHSSVIATVGRLAALGHDVYFYDQIGSGLSDRLPRPKDYSFLGHIGDLHEIITKHLRAPRVILIGHSYGGQLAAQYVALHPERVERVVLSSPGSLEPAQFDGEGHWINARKYVPPASVRIVPPKGAEGGFDRWPPRALAAIALAMINVKLMPDAEADGVLNTLASKFTRDMVCDPKHVRPEEGGGGFYAHGWSNYYGDLQDPRPRMRHVSAPVLVVQGDCDYFPYASTYEYVDVFPHAEYRLIHGAGHILWWDKPAEYAGVIGEFVRVQNRAP